MLVVHKENSILIHSLVRNNDFPWAVEFNHRYCPNFVKPATDHDVTSQLDCQQKCRARNNCIGIGYSHRIGYTGWCYICMDDNLNTASNDFAFYRKPRPGKALDYKP